MEFQAQKLRKTDANTKTWINGHLRQDTSSNLYTISVNTKKLIMWLK